MKTLKNSTLFCLLLLFVSIQFATAQKLVNASEVTPSLLKETCDNAYIEVL